MDLRDRHPVATGGVATREIVRLARVAMATRFEIVLAGDDPVRLRAIGEAALHEVAACEAAISPFVAGSSIARVNRDAQRRAVRVDPLTFELLQACVQLHRATDGAFDPTVGPLMRALGFRDLPATDDPAALAAARAAVGMGGVVLDPATCTVRLMREGMALDLGAIGKGHAIDLAAEVVREHGVRCALLHGGTSTVLAIGAPPGNDGWRVALGRGRGAPVTTLRDEALSVSAVHGRRAADGSPHVLDPRTGAPAADGIALAAVVAPTARVADAWSTAVLVRSATPAPPYPLRVATFDPRAMAAFLDSAPISDPLAP